MSALLLSALSAGANLGAQALTNAKNMKLAKYQYSKELEMWNRQNEYNAPAAQMSRLEAAGLNKNLVYGQGSVVGNTSSQLPQFQAPEYKMESPLPSAIGALSSFVDLEAKKANIDAVKANTKTIELENALKAATLESKIYMSNILKPNILNTQRSILGWTETEKAIKGSTLQSLYSTSPELLSDNLKATLFKPLIENELKSGQLQKYSAETKGVNLNNTIKQIEADFMKSLGVHSVKDILPAVSSVLNLLFRKKK